MTRTDQSENIYRADWVKCRTCHGQGAPSHFDDETATWSHYVCRSCGGNGGHYEPRR